MRMKRFAAVALGLVIAAFPVWAQHGGGSHGGGHAGGFGGGHAAPAFHGGFSGGGSRSFGGPVFHGGFRAPGQVGAPGSRPIAHPVYGAPRYGARVPYGSGIRYGARPPMAGTNFRRVDPGRYDAMRHGFDRRRDGDHRGYRDHYRRPYIATYWPTYSYYAYPWIWPGYSTILDCDNPDDNLDCGYGNGGYGGYGDNGYGNYGYENGPGDGGYDRGNYGMLGAEPGYDEPNLGSWPATPPQYQEPAAVQPSAAPSSEEAVTIIFRDGRPAETIYNYVLTPTVLYAGDITHRQVISINQIDIPATEKANAEAGVDFHIPQMQVQTLRSPGYPDAQVLSPQ